MDQPVLAHRDVRLLRFTLCDFVRPKFCDDLLHRPVKFQRVDVGRTVRVTSVHHRRSFEMVRETNERKRVASETRRDEEYRQKRQSEEDDVDAKKTLILLTRSTAYYLSAKHNNIFFNNINDII